jgi:Na+-driven multidrug efflux pump
MQWLLGLLQVWSLMLEKYLQVQGIMGQPACASLAVLLLNILLQYLLVARMGFQVRQLHCHHHHECVVPT